MNFDRPEQIGVGQQIPRRAFDAPLRERRQEPRTTMTRVICFNMGPDNGGVVTDICSSGMGVRTDLPMTAAGEVSFSLMVDGSILRGSAEVVWMDKVGKGCGLRFISVTPSLRLQINQWIVDPQSDLPARAELRSGAAPEPEPAIAEADATRTSDTEPQGAHPVGRETFLIDDWAERDRQTSSTRSRAFVGGFATGLVVAGVVASVLFYFGLATFGRTSALAKVPPAPAIAAPSASVPPSSGAVGGSAAPSADVQGAPDSAAAANPSTAPAPPAAASAPATATPPALTAYLAPRQQDPDSAAPNAPAAPQPPKAQERTSPGSSAAGAGASTLDEADAYLRSGRGREAAALLWSAVSVGNTAAETKLADLYLRGEGVGKSCVQGKVLLTAAAKEGNADAQQRLSSLLRSGCR